MSQQKQGQLEEYLTVQQIYRGWAFLDIVELGALLTTLGLNIMTRKKT